MTTELRAALEQAREALPRANESESVYCMLRGHDLRALIDFADAALAQAPVDAPAQPQVEIDRLRAELASVKEDAERYKWLKACASENDDGEIFLYYLCDFDHYNDPDASIDAARSAPKER